MTGQDAVNVAQAFADKVGLTGIVLTRVDGDARGGAALSMRMTTGCPIKLIGVGEKLDALEGFHPNRIAGRILGMGDIVGLVEKAQETIEQAEAERLARKVQKGDFDLDDMAQQLKQMRKMGGLEGVVGMMPGVAKVKKQLAQANIDDQMIRRQEAIISSMTKQERRNPKVIHASRRRRIAAGSGTTVQDVNKLLKQHLQMTKMMKRMGKLGKKGAMRGLPPGQLPPGFGRI
jgi:signal recognition particle subunit SRP54